MAGSIFGQSDSMKREVDEFCDKCRLNDVFHGFLERYKSLIQIRWSEIRRVLIKDIDDSPEDLRKVLVYLRKSLEDISLETYEGWFLSQMKTKMYQVFQVVAPARLEIFGEEFDENVQETLRKLLPARINGDDINDVMDCVDRELINFYLDKKELYAIALTLPKAAAQQICDLEDAAASIDGTIGIMVKNPFRKGN